MQKLRWGMVGGGPGAGIGQTHRYAAVLDGRFDLLAGAFSRDFARSRAIGEELGLSPDRVYPDFESMAAGEARRSDGIQCVSIVTPNNTHAAISQAFMARRIHVICDKPITTTFADAVEIMAAAKSNDVVFALTHNYSAYPMVIEARHLVNSDVIGAIRLVQAEYAQGSRNRLVEAEGDAKMIWRVDREIGGPSTVLGDLGTHAHHLMRFITGLEIESLSADLSTVVRGRKADDNAYINLRFRGGARGQFWSSMAATGNGHGLRIRVFGEKASLHWDHETPNQLEMRSEGQPYQILRRGEPYLSDETKRATRVKIGQPEGYIEAFANVYLSAADAIRAKMAGRKIDGSSHFFASAKDGAIAMKFIEASVLSSGRNAAWVDATVDLEE
jgi:predicted dehydrogenase